MTERAGGLLGGVVSSLSKDGRERGAGSRLKKIEGTRQDSMLKPPSTNLYPTLAPTLEIPPASRNGTLNLWTPHPITVMPLPASYLNPCRTCAKGPAPLPTTHLAQDLCNPAERPPDVVVAQVQCPERLEC